MECLLERDGLQHAQDSLLVDVEDLSRFLTKVTEAKVPQSTQSEALQH